jgi:hypothetical protein
MPAATFTDRPSPVVRSSGRGQGEACFDLSWAGIDGTVVAAHIHVGPAGVAGPVVVPLFVGVALSGTDRASSCLPGVSQELIEESSRVVDRKVMGDHAATS